MVGEYGPWTILKQQQQHKYKSVTFQVLFHRSKEDNDDGYRMQVLLEMIKEGVILYTRDKERQGKL